MAANRRRREDLERRRDEKLRPRLALLNSWLAEQPFGHKLGPVITSVETWLDFVEDADRRMAGVWYRRRPLKPIIRKFITAYALTASCGASLRSQIIRPSEIRAQSVSDTMATNNACGRGKTWYVQYS